MPFQCDITRGVLLDESIDLSTLVLLLVAAIKQYWREKQLSDFSSMKEEMQEAGRSIMRDQQPKRPQKRSVVAGNAPISYKPTNKSPSNPQYERKRDYAYYKGILVIGQCRLLSSILTYSSKTSAR